MKKTNKPWYFLFVLYFLSHGATFEVARSFLNLLIQDKTYKNGYIFDLQDSKFRENYGLVSATFNSFWNLWPTRYTMTYVLVNVYRMAIFRRSKVRTSISTSGWLSNASGFKAFFISAALYDKSRL